MGTKDILFTHISGIPKMQIKKCIMGMHGTPIFLLYYMIFTLINVCLFVFYVPLTTRSFRDAPPFTLYCPLRRTCSSVNTLFSSGIEPRVIAWQSITLPLRHASFNNRLALLKEKYTQFNLTV